MSKLSIVGFTGEHSFLSMAYPLNKPLIEKIGPAMFRYPTLRKAYYAHSTDDLGLKATIITMENTEDLSTVVPIEFRRNDWSELRERVLYQLLKQKFKDSTLRLKLKHTGTKELIHVNPDNLFWGTDGEGEGENRLGKLLMKLREEISAKNCTAAA